VNVHKYVEGYEVSKKSTEECAVRSEDISRPALAEGVRSHWFVNLLKIHCSLFEQTQSSDISLRRLPPVKPSVHYTWSVPKVMSMIFFGRSAEGPGKENGSRGRCRGTPSMTFDLPQLGPAPL